MMSFKEFKAVCAAKVAGPQKEANSKDTAILKTSSTASPSPSALTSSQELHMKMSKIFSFIDDTYQDLRRFNLSLQKNFGGTLLMQTINKYKNGCKDMYAKALDSYDLCHKLSQNIVRTMDIFKELSTCLSDLEEYNYRLCEIMSIFIVCELRLSVDITQQEHLLIAHRIIYIMRRHLVRDEEQETLYNILRTLVFIPKLFNARDIMCAIFGEFIPIKPVLEVKVLPDNLYMLYITVFYRWMMMQKNDEDKILIVNFAESFMKPSVSLCSNNLYGAYLPMYTTHSTATRTILNNLKYYRDVRNASIIDNALKKIAAVVNLCDDEDDVVVVDSSPTIDFVEIFTSVRLEPLSDSISNIKLEEKTLVSTVDLTEEEECADPIASINERHDKWLNEFRRLAKQYRESQILLEKQQSIQLISNEEKEAVICLDSESEEEEEISAVVCTKTNAAAEATLKNNSEDLFVDNYPLTNTPINCDSDLESLNVEDENDVTKISPRFLSGTLRTYQAKKCHISETGDKNSSHVEENHNSQLVDKAYRRDSIHISFTPPENEDDEGTDVQDEHDDLLDEEGELNYSNSNTANKKEAQILPKQIRPMGPYPTYNNMNNGKANSSEAVFRYHQHQNQHKYQDKQYYNSDSSDTRTSRNQKKRVQFNTSPIGPTVPSAPQKIPLKPALQQPKYKASEAIDYFHTRGLEHRSCASSIAGSTSTSASNSSFSKQQEPTNEKCNDQTTCNVKKYNSYKNLSVFKQTSLNMNIKQKSTRNVKINLKKIRLDNDISLTNFKSKLISREQPHITTLALNNNRLNEINNINSTSIKIESCHMKTSSISTATDDKIFKKPLPVTKKLFRSPKPLTIQKNVSFRTHPYSFKPKETIRTAETVKQSVSDLKKSTNNTEAENTLVSTLTAFDDTKTNSEFGLSDSNMDDLSKISKMLTEKINRLTSETVEKAHTKEQNKLDINKESQKDQEFRHEQSKVHPQNDLVTMVCNDESAKKQVKTIEMVLEDEGSMIRTNIEKSNKGPSNQIASPQTINLASVNKSDPLSILLNKTSEVPKVIEPEKKSQLSGNTETGPNKKAELISEILEETKNSYEPIQQKTKDEPLKEIDNGTMNVNDTLPELSKLSECDSRELSIIDDTIISTLEKEDESELKSAEVAQSLAKLVANFSAEFLAGLPNEPSPSQQDTVNSGCESKTDIDFDFENHCTTPTMCRIDLDVMSENTSDIPSTMPLTMLPMEECEADKLLEDFNNKTEDIVGSSLNKKGISYETNVSKITSGSSASPAKSCDVLPGNENDFKTTESLVVDTVGEKLKKLRNTDVLLNENLISKASKNLMASISVVNAETNSGKDIALDCEQKMEEMHSDKKPKNFLTDIQKFHKSKKRNLLSQEEGTGATSEKKLKKISKDFDKNLSLSKENLDKIVNFKSDECFCDTDKNELSSQKEVKTSQIEAPINEDQHMTVELGNWKQNSPDEAKANESEPQGGGEVSAIFSFPKIPIISISIRTTPNNKTYFKISNRENESQKKEGGKTKKAKSPQPEQEGERYNEEKTITRSGLECTEIKNVDKLLELPVEEYNEEDDEEVEKEEQQERDEEEEECDNFEIEKFSHDSNSACSLPLKKRPTQAEPNDDAEDSQSAVSGSYEQVQEIAAEVVIENTCKDKALVEDRSSPTLLQEEKRNDVKTELEFNTDTISENINIDESNLLNDIDDNKPSTSSACFKKSDPSSPFQRRVHVPIRPMGQTPIQIVAPQLKDSSSSPSQDHRTADVPLSGSPRMIAQGIQPLPESYPATPMLSVANVEKLMDFNRFIEDLLASSDVMTIIDNANACGYYAEGQTYEMERIAILEHYNIANAKGNTSVTKPLYWKKSAGDTISIFNDNDNEWISLPPSTAKQLQKLSFVLSILQQQYKVTDIRQRINIALTFLIRNTSKYKKNTSSSVLQQRMPIYSRNISDLSSSNHNIPQTLPSNSYFRISANNEALTSSFNVGSNPESVQDFRSTNFSSNLQQPEIALQSDPVVDSNQNWNNLMQYAGQATPKGSEQSKLINSPQGVSSNNVECEQQQQQQQTQTQDKRNSAWDELNNDQLYINPPCASSPQNEVIVNTNGVQLHEMPQDQQNIFISITDEAGPNNANTELPLHKYNTRQQQQQFRTLDDPEVASSSASLPQQSYAKRQCLANSGSSLIQNHILRGTIMSTFGNQDINLQNPYGMQQQQMASTSSNTTTNANSPIHIYTSNRHSSSLPHQQSQQRMCSRFTSSYNTQLPVSSQQTEIRNTESNYKEILQPYITYLIKDHEKTSKHLLQVFEEVSNSNPTVETGDIDFNQQTLLQNQQQFSTVLPPLIRNPQQNHMPGLSQIASSNGTILPSLIRNPHQNILSSRDSGALQVVQSFLEQSQTSFDAAQQHKILIDQQQKQSQQKVASSHPGFAKEYVNFVGSRDELTQKYKLRTFYAQQGEKQKQMQQQQQQQQKQFSEQLLQQRQEKQRINSLKRKCQERNDKLTEDLKNKIMEFTLLKHNVQVKLMEKQENKHKTSPSGEVKNIDNSNAATKRRGRPRKTNKLPLENNQGSAILSNTDNSCHVASAYPKQKQQYQCTTRLTRRNQTHTDLATTDHAYFRQRSAAREAVKRINAAANSSFQ